MSRFVVCLVPALLLVPAAASAQVVANAGDDVTLECASAEGTEFNLDGTGSSEGPDFEYLWTSVPDVELDDETTLTPVGTFPLGTTTTTLQVTDTATNAMNSDSVDVTVVDTTPPVVRVFADPFVLWPPNHGLREVQLRIRVRDRCSADGDVTIELLSVMSDEPDNGTGDGDTANDIQDVQLGTDDRAILLRAERKGNGDGRVYTATYRVTDASGNVTDVTARVFVPHDASHLERLLDDHRDDERSSLEDICPTPSAAVDEFSSALPRLDSFASRRLCMRTCRVWAQGCRNLANGAAMCERAERRALAGLEAVECRDTDDFKEARQCTRDVRGDHREDSMGLREERREAQDICRRRGQRCANACRDLF
jgi:hypothetical protein